MEPWVFPRLFVHIEAAWLLWFFGPLQWLFGFFLDVLRLWRDNPVVFVQQVVPLVVLLFVVGVVFWMFHRVMRVF